MKRRTKARRILSIVLTVMLVFTGMQSSASFVSAADNHMDINDSMQAVESDNNANDTAFDFSDIFQSVEVTQNEHNKSYTSTESETNSSEPAEAEADAENAETGDAGEVSTGGGATNVSPPVLPQEPQKPENDNNYIYDGSEATGSAGYEGSEYDKDNEYTKEDSDIDDEYEKEDKYEKEDEYTKEDSDIEDEYEIVSLSVGLFTPLEILELTDTITWFEVHDEADLRAALSNTAAIRVIRVMNDITLTTASELPFAGASTTVHIYSNTNGAFAINRGTSTSRHFNLSAGSRVLNLYNVRLTRNPGATQENGRVTPGGPDNFGGGIAVTTSGARVFMHAGSEISHNRASGRGGGINITSGIVTMNPGSRIYSNVSNHLTAAGADSGGGGGVSISNGATLNVNSGTIENNFAARGHGGGIQVAHGGGTADAGLHINSIRLIDNEARNNGGGIHSNSNANITMTGVSVIDGNTGEDGGGMRVFSRNAANFNLYPGSIISNNVARGNGAGISIAHTGTSNANVIGLRVNGVTFDNNIAIGTGGAIHHEGPAMAAARGIIINDSTFTNNRASDGGAISMVASETNLPVTAHAARLTICANTIFSGNSATNGLLVDENLAARNATHISNSGSAVWYGPRTDAAGNLLAVELRNHVWNNYDIMSRNQLEARDVRFNPIGTASSASNMMEAELTQTIRSTNPGAAAIGLATTAPVAVNPYIELNDGDAAMRNSHANFRVAYLPWNADVIYWVNNQSTREWVGDPVTGTLVETTQTTIIPNSAGLLELNNVITIGQHTLIQVRIDYRYHDVTFNVSPTSPVQGGTLTEGSTTGLTTVTRNLRESRHPNNHTGTITPNGNPIGTPPTPVATTPGWAFTHWTLNGATVTEAQIAEMYVTGPMTFTANFAQGFALTINNIPAVNAINQTQSGGVIQGTPIVLQSGTAAGWEFRGWMTAAEVAENNVQVGTPIASIQHLLRETHSFNMPSANTTYVAIWTGYNGTHVGQQQLTIANRPNIAVTSQTLSGPRTPGALIQLAHGTPTSSWELLGWVRGDVLPEPGTNINDFTGDVRPAGWSFDMPQANVTYTAIWGNQGVVGANLVINNVPDVTPAGQTLTQPVPVGQTRTLEHGVPAVNLDFFGWVRGTVVPNPGDNFADFTTANPNVVFPAGHTTNSFAADGVYRYTAIWGIDGIVGANLIIDNIPEQTPGPMGQTPTQAVLVGENRTLMPGVAPLDLEFGGWIRGTILPEVGDVLADWLYNNPTVDIHQNPHTTAYFAANTVLRYTAIWICNEGIVGGANLIIGNVPEQIPRPTGQTSSQRVAINDYVILSPGAAPTGMAGIQLQFAAWVRGANIPAAGDNFAAWVDDNIGLPGVFVTDNQTHQTAAFADGTILRYTAIWVCNEGIVGGANLVIGNVPAQNPRPAGQTLSQTVPVGENRVLVPGDAPLGIEQAQLEFGGWIRGNVLPQEGDVLADWHYDNSTVDIHQDPHTTATFAAGTILRYTAIWICENGIVGGGHWRDVTFNLNGGNVGGSETNVVYNIRYESQIGVANVPVPIRANHSFLGWRLTGQTANLTRDQVAAHVVTEDITFTAQWLLNTDQPDPDPDPWRRPQIEDPPVPLAFIQDHIWYVQGFPDETFRAENSITRAEFAMIIFRLLDSATKNNPQPARFNDVGTTSWYAQAVNYLAQIGILMGYPDGSFRPGAHITRAELTAVMSRFFEMQDNGTSTFSDVSDAHWAFAYISDAYNRGWVTGFTDGSFRPNNDTTRAETVTLINRVLERTPNPVTINYHLDDIQIFTDLTSSRWAFYQIMEAAIGHTYVLNAQGLEEWTSIYIPGRTL